VAIQHDAFICHFAITWRPLPVCGAKANILLLKIGFQAVPLKVTNRNPLNTKVQFAFWISSEIQPESLCFIPRRQSPESISPRLQEVLCSKAAAGSYPNTFFSTSSQKAESRSTGMLPAFCFLILVLIVCRHTLQSRETLLSPGKCR